MYLLTKHGVMLGIHVVDLRAEVVENPGPPISPGTFFARPHISLAALQRGAIPVSYINRRIHETGIFTYIILIYVYSMCIMVVNMNMYRMYLCYIYYI